MIFYYSMDELVPNFLFIDFIRKNSRLDKKLEEKTERGKNKGSSKFGD